MIALEPAVPPEALEAIRTPFLEKGASGVDVPVMQPLALLLDLAGEAMRARLFVVQADGIDEA
ncbi:MAG: ATP phosphoribosyltransferase regulatory subunit, partial [Caulobacteraceae bacterium]